MMYIQATIPLAMESFNPVAFLAQALVAKGQDRWHHNQIFNKFTSGAYIWCDIYENILIMSQHFERYLTEIRCTRWA